MTESRVLNRVRAYIRTRLRDPSAWLSILFIAPMAGAAMFGFSLRVWWSLVETVALGMTLLEWMHLAGWRKRDAVLERETIARLPPASDRWKVFWMAPVTAVLLALEVWIDLRLDEPPFVSFGLTALGASTFFTLWLTWSCAVRVTASGVVIGTGLVRWQDIGRVSWLPDAAGGVVRFDFSGPGHYWFGGKMVVPVTPQELQRLHAALPQALEIRGPLAGPSHAANPRVGPESKA